MDITVGLSDQLITSLTGVSVQNDAAKFKSLQLLVQSVINNANTALTNPFAVNNQLNGLQEKFRVLNNEELADALGQRIAALSCRTTQWTPEVLSLLLQLSENPAQQTKLEDLDLLEDPPSLPPLTWDQILADDPLDNDEGLWNDVDFGAGSSDDDGEILPDSLHRIRPVSVSSSSDTQSIGDSNEGLEPSDSAILSYVTDAQYWQPLNSSTEENEDKVFVTETQVIRDAIFMLLGLPTNMFQLSEGGHLHASNKYRVRRISTAAFEDILASLASVGQALMALRNWTASSQTVAMVQTLQSGLFAKLQAFDTALWVVETELLHPVDRVPMTLLRVNQKVQAVARPLLRLMPVLVKRQDTSMDRPFELLESLYELVCTSESKLDRDAMSFFADLFLDCFRTYLKPIRRWMEDGELDEDDKVFFVKRNEDEQPLTCLWSEQYRLVKTNSGLLHAPRFLHVAAQKIFNTGKSVSFTRSLGFHEKSHDLLPSQEPPSHFQFSCGEQDLDRLSPFSERFAAAFQKWIASMHLSSSSSLRELMGSRCGFWNSLDALELIYLSRNGACTSQVATSVFERIDGTARNWKDRFVLTELFRRAYGQLDCVNGEQLSVSTVLSKKDSTSISMTSLADIHIVYKIPWAAANIIKPNSFTTYQRVTILVLQILRAKQLLARKLPVSLAPQNQQWKSTFATICAIRHRQLWFVSSVHAHLAMVLAKGSSEMRAALKKARDFDEMIAVHEDYIAHLEKQCLLSATLASTHQAIVSLLDLAIVFSDTRKAWNQMTLGKRTVPQKSYCRTESASSEEEHSDAEQEPGHIERHEGYAERLAKISSTFDRLLEFVVAGLQEASRSGLEPSWGMLVDSLALWDRS